jgi:hypothetical protein
MAKIFKVTPTIINLTGATVKVTTDNGHETFKAGAKIVINNEEPVETIKLTDTIRAFYFNYLVKRDDCDSPLLPPPVENTLYIVSRAIFNANIDRTDLIVPNANIMTRGTIICNGFIVSPNINNFTM